MGYLKAMNQIMLPFTKPPASLTDYAGARRKLDKAVTQLGSLTPPPLFAPSQAQLVMALRTQATLTGQMARAAAKKDAVAANNLEARVLRAEQVIRAVGHDEVSIYDRCRASSFRSC